MISNLILLPTLLLSLDKTIANEEEFVEPTINILTDEFSDEDFEEENSNEK